MKRFQVVVNGNSYEVEVEELKDGQAAAPVRKQAAPQAPKTSSLDTVSTLKDEPVKAKVDIPDNATVIEAPMPGKIVGISVELGDVVKDGDLIGTLEAMKMENEVFASASGTIASVNVSAGDIVETGDVIVSIN